MCKVLIVSHGPMANATLESIKLIMGSHNFNDVHSYGLFHEDSVEELEIMLTKHFVENEKGLVVFTDLFGGSPNNIVARVIYNLENRENVLCICGFSLPLVLETISLKNTMPFDELKAHIKGIMNNCSFDVMERLGV